MHMADWIVKLDDFLRLSDRDILTHLGKVSHELAEQHAHMQFASYEEQRRQIEAAEPTSDFDKAVEQLRREQPPGESKAAPGGEA